MTPSRKPLRASLAVAALALTACSLDVPDPTGTNPIQIQLDFCSNEIPIWFAHQNGNGPFQVVTPDASGTYTFMATTRTALAWVNQSGSDYRTEVLFTSNLDLELVSGQACLEEVGTKQLNGTATGHTGSELALVSMGVSSVYLNSSQTSFTLTNLVDRPLDLIASRHGLVDSEQHANKTVIRRAQNLVNGATIAPINFNNEGFTPVQNTVNVVGIGSGDDAFLMNNFFTQLGTSHALSFAGDISDGSVPFVSVPGAETVTGDYHDLFVVSTTQTGSARGVERFFRNPANQSIALGPVLSEPQVSVISATPHVRLRTRVLGQSEYSTVLGSEYHQETPFNTIDVNVFVTASYFGGTPIEWDVPMPNFQGLPGWQTSWGLQPGDVEWTISALFGRPQLIFGGQPNDGEAVSFASRSARQTVLEGFQARRGSRPPMPLRPRR